MVKHILGPCSAEVPYPETGLLVFSKERTSENSVYLIPHDELFADIKSMVRGMRKFQKILAASPYDMRMEDQVLMCVLTRVRLFPLKPEYWNSPGDIYGPGERMNVFSRLLDHPTLHHLLVTPGRDKKRWYFRPALPITAGTDDRVTEQFMELSDWYVAPEAKYAAVYDVGTPWYFDIQTKKQSVYLRPISSSRSIS